MTLATAVSALSVALSLSTGPICPCHTDPLPLVPPDCIATELGVVVVPPTGDCLMRDPAGVGRPLLCSISSEVAGQRMWSCQWWDGRPS